jgi:hypothetical protein
MQNGSVQDELSTDRNGDKPNPSFSAAAAAAEIAGPAVTRAAAL